MSTHNLTSNYFSSSLDNSAPNWASFLAFHPNGINIQCCNRYFGLSIRPVYKSKESVVTSDVKTKTSAVTLSTVIDKINYADFFSTDDKIYMLFNKKCCPDVAPSKHIKNCIK